MNNILFTRFSFFTSYFIKEMESRVANQIAAFACMDYTHVSKKTRDTDTEKITPLCVITSHRVVHYLEDIYSNY